MSDSGDVFNIERLKELVGLMEEHSLHEVDLRQGEQQIQLKRGGPVPAAPMPAPAAVAPQPAAAAPAASAGGEDEIGRAHV